MQIPYRCTYAKQLLWKDINNNCIPLHDKSDYICDAPFLRSNRNQCSSPAPDYVLKTCQDNYNNKIRRRVDDKTQATVLRNVVIVLFCTTTHTIPTTKSVKTIELTGDNHSLLIITCLNSLLCYDILSRLFQHSFINQSKS